MELGEGLKTRKSCRAYLPEPVPEEIIREILAEASRAPSCLNTQPWEVVVVAGKKKDELSRRLVALAEADAPREMDIPMANSWPPAHKDRFRQHSALRMKTLGVDPRDAGERRKLEMRNFTFLGAPCVLYLMMDATLPEWSIFDMGLFAGNLLLAAHRRGLGTCLQGTAVAYAAAVHECLGIPETKKLVVGIALGYPDTASRINSYRSQRDEVASFTSWQLE